MCIAILLAQSQKENCRMLAELASSGINQDGQTANFSAPSGSAQEALVRLALHRANINLRSHSIEAHGTGTQLGDPIEVEALFCVLGSGVPDCSFVIGALKSRTGHTEHAAGMAGVLKSVMSLQLGCLQPNLHLIRTNTHLRIELKSALLPSQVIGYNTTKSLGVSSFGMSGTNAHAVVSAAKWCELPLCIRAPTSRFKATRFAWWDANTANASALLGAAQIDAGGRAWWEHTWTRTTCSYLAHHRIGSAPVAPGTAFLWIAHTAAAGEHTPKTQISSSQFEAMLFLDSDGLGPTLTVICQSGTVTIDSRDAAGVRISHALIALSEASQWKTTPHYLSLGESNLHDGTRFYMGIGNGYRGAFRAVESIWLYPDGSSVTKVQLACPLEVCTLITPCFLLI